MGRSRQKWEDRVKIDLTGIPQGTRTEESEYKDKWRGVVKRRFYMVCKRGERRKYSLVFQFQKHINDSAFFNILETILSLNKKTVSTYKYYITFIRLQVTYNRI